MSIVVAAVFLLSLAGLIYFAPPANAAGVTIDLLALTPGSSGSGWSFNGSTLNISDDVSVINTASDILVVITGGEVSWNAALTGNTQDTKLISVNGGSLTVTGGLIQTANHHNNAIENSAGTVNIVNGTVIASGSESYAIYNRGEINISGGLVQAYNNCMAIDNNAGGVVNISGGVVQASEGVIYNRSGGVVSVSGGTVSSGSGMAIFSDGGIIAVSQANASKPTLISAANNNGTIMLDNSASFSMTGGTVQNTAATGKAIFNNGSGGIAVSGGTVSATGDRGFAINSVGTGAITIDGGTVSAAGGDGAAIWNDGTGNITVSGGEVKTTGTNGCAIYNYDIGMVTIEGGTVSATGTIGCAIHNKGTGDITVSGGTVKMTGTDGGATIYNQGTSDITVSGGIVSAANIAAIFNELDGTVSVSSGVVYNQDILPAIVYLIPDTVAVSGGLVFSHGAGLNDVIPSPPVPTGFGVIAAWDKIHGAAAYTAGTADDLVVSPANNATNDTARWGTRSMKHGIIYNNSNFFEVSGVTVTEIDNGGDNNGGNNPPANGGNNSNNGGTNSGGDTSSGGGGTSGYTNPDMTPFYGDIGQTAPDTSSGTADAPSGWAAAAVKKALELKLIPSRLQGGWTADLNRADFCALAVKLYEYLDGKPITARAHFDDTDDVNVQKLAGLGIIQGDGTGKFDPDAVFTREMALTLMYNMMVQLGHAFEPAEPSFADAGDISPWAKAAIGALQKAGIVSGDGQYFNPSQVFTREMGIVTIINFLRGLTPATSP